MSFVKILVPVAGAARDRFALATAFAAAKPFNAHVVAMFVHADPREAVPYGELPLSPDIVQDLIDTAADLEKASGDAAVQLTRERQLVQTTTKEREEAKARVKELVATLASFRPQADLTSALQIADGTVVWRKRP